MITQLVGVNWPFCFLKKYTARKPNKIWWDSQQIMTNGEDSIGIRIRITPAIIAASPADFIMSEFIIDKLLHPSGIKRFRIELLEPTREQP